MKQLYSEMEERNRQMGNKNAEQGMVTQGIRQGVIEADDLEQEIEQRLNTITSSSSKTRRLE
jgi:uncharacterized protein (DUF3084 family)